MRPAAASILVPEWLGDTGEATVLAVLPHAVHLRSGAWTEVLCVLDAEALRLPNSVVVGSVGTGRGEPLGSGLNAGDRVRVDAGRLILPAAVIECRRTFRPAMIAPGAGLGTDPRAVRDLARGLRPGLPGMAAAAAEVTRAVEAVAGITEAAEAAGAAEADSALAETGATSELNRVTGRLIGRGPGLTPTGDDVLAGVLLGLRAAERLVSVRWLARAVARSLPHTTSLSAALLQAAAGGWCVPEVRDACSMLRAGFPAESLALLGRIGHSSGHDLATGFLAALPAQPGSGGHVPGPRLGAHPAEAAVTDSLGPTDHPRERTLHV